jgi:hypothetical protein
MKLPVLIRAMLLAGFALGLTGCETVENYSLTYRLWENSDMEKWSGPAPEPHLALFDATNRADILVRYDAFSEKQSVIRQRAYYLQANQARIARHKKPTFVQPSAIAGMNSIPVLNSAAGITNLPPDDPTYAVTANGDRGFTLYQSNQSLGTFDLPAYAESSGVPARVVLTPFAVVGDTVMVGVVAAVVASYWWLVSGAPGANTH